MRKKFIIKVSSFMLTLLLLVNTLAVVPVVTNAAEVTKTEKTHDIAVVFDNSASMYMNGSMAWCRAKYAMEIFASMINYETDKLNIFPMWEVTTDKTYPAYGKGGSYAPFEIKNKDDIDKISNLFTVTAHNTPLAPVTEAHEYLKTSTADEKWLIILTDGVFNMSVRKKDANINIKKELDKIASQSPDINLQYLGFGAAANFNSGSANLDVKISDDKSLQNDLIDICNKIFQREVLDAKWLNGNKLKLDVSMKNVIVFAQGDNAKITGLKSSGGEAVPITLNSGQRKYSNIKANGYETAVVDTSLAGQVVTFGACPKGTYELACSGADKIQIFYEPDVDIDVTIINSEGVKVTGPENFFPGEYTITSKIVDSATGEDVTKHELLGDNVKLTTFVKTSKDGTAKQYPNGAKIAFENDSQTEIYVEGEYLGKYKINSKDNSKLDWLSNINIAKPSVAFAISAETEQDWYELKKHDDWKPVKVKALLNGKPLTDEEMKSVKLTVESKKDIKYRYEPIPGTSEFNLYIAQDDKGKYIEPATGKYKLIINATYTDEFGDAHKAQKAAESKFEIQNYSKIWRVLVWVFGFSLLFVLWLLFMLQKVLPKDIKKDSGNYVTISSGELDANFVDVEYRRKAKTLTISGSNAVDYGEQCNATFSLRAVDNRFTNAKRRRIGIIGIDSPCDELKLGGTKYVNYEGQWVKNTDLRKAETGKPVSPIDQEMSPSPRYELSRNGGTACLTCKTKTMK